MYYFNEKVVERIVSVASVFLTAFLLVGAITALYWVTNARARLGLIAGFTILFAGTIGLLTNARRAETLAATAALVLFPGSYSMKHVLI